MHIYIFSPITYSFLHQRPQKLADQFQSLSIRVTYIGPSGFKETFIGSRRGRAKLLLRSFTYHILGVLALAFPSLRDNGKPGKQATASLSKFDVLSVPFVIPMNRFDSPLWEKLITSIYRQFLQREVRASMIDGEESLALVQNPFWGNVLERGDFDRICYDCMDDMSLYSGRASTERYERYEHQLVSISDAVFVTASRLEEHIRSFDPVVRLERIPNGVDFEWFAASAKNSNVPSDLRGLPRPIIGYTGFLASWFDYALMNAIAKRMINASFVFVGPLDSSERIRDLKTASNIHWLGRKEYVDIPSYVNAFDVCIIPFLPGRVAQTTNPVKVYEYFALGKPVVSTRLVELECYTEQNLVRIADTQEDFIDAIASALDENDADRSLARMNIAREHSWKAIAHRMVTAMGAD